MIVAVLISFHMRMCDGPQLSAMTHLDFLMMIRDDWLGDDSFVAAVELEVSMTWHILTWYFDLPTCAGHSHC